MILCYHCPHLLAVRRCYSPLPYLIQETGFMWFPHQLLAFTSRTQNLGHASSILPHWVGGRPATLYVSVISVISPLQSLMLIPASSIQGYALSTGGARMFSAHGGTCHSEGIHLIVET
jgi:hypothetical protein